ncbi:MAG: sensor protein [Thiobacillus sp. 65-69]|nr:PAS domain-containing protein [Thiobacillus sp.]ODU89162.1 MAG: sensor protein [Thiobacillus sp. SCN 65-179]OJW34474.1 MAG: sensor protein [Thiobacillus sp. 65-69]
MSAFKPADPNALLRTVLRETESEVLAFDTATLRILAVNAAAARNLGHPQTHLRDMRLDDCLAANEAAMLASRLARDMAGPARRIALRAHCRRRDGSLYPVAVRIVPTGDDGQRLWIARDLSGREAARLAMTQSPPDLRAVVAHIPGMAYQVLRKPDGSTTLRYVSAQSARLLGIKAASLRARPERFFDLILDEDKPDYLTRLAAAGGVPMSFNWEGRIWLKAWHDVKWVNLRVSRRETPEGTIWDGIMLNVTHSREADAEIRRSRAQLAALAAHVETAKEQERLNLAREVHDDLGGNLAAIKIGLSGLLRRLPGDQTALIERTAYLDNVVDQTIEATHRIAASLRPPVLDFGIVSALEWQIERFGHTTGMACTLDAPATPIPLGTDAAIAVFRIVQEALTNVAKHARASRVKVGLALDGDTLVVRVTDNGQGIAAKPPRNGSGFGVLGMTERAAALGGELIVEAAPRRGTQVRLQVPLAPGK